WSIAWLACCAAPDDRASESCTRRASSWKFFWLHCQTHAGAAIATTSASSASQSAARDGLGADDARAGTEGDCGGVGAPVAGRAPGESSVRGFAPGLAAGFGSMARSPGEGGELASFFGPALPSAFAAARGSAFGPALG